VIGLKTSEGVVLMFTAVTAFSQNRNVDVTRHPVESGSVISDHITQNPLSISISGIFVGRDFEAEQVDDYLFMDGLSTGVALSYIGAAPVLTDYVSISSDKPSSLQKLIPQGFSNLLSPALPAVTLEEGLQPTSLDSIQLLLESWQKTGKDLTVLIFENNLLKNITTSCVIKSLSIAEDADTGDSLAVDLSLEEVRFVTLGKASIGKVTWKEVDLSPKKQKGTKGTGSGDPASPSASPTEAAPPAAPEVDDCMTSEGRGVNVGGIGLLCMANWLSGGNL